MSKRTAAHKARTVAKGHVHAKPAHALHRGGATGHAAKHHKAAKHHAAGKKHKGTVARGLAPAADQVACCAAEALAASLRLQGHAVADADVLALYWRTADDPDAGAPIAATLEAATRFGLAGIRPLSWAPEKLPDFIPADIPRQAILGLDLQEGPHTVLATPEGWWWSWGELYCPWCEWPDAVVEEAWEVTWL